MKHIHLLVLISLLNACFASNEINKHDVSAEHKIYCSGTEYDWDTCYKNAQKLCGEKGYEELEKYEDQGALVSYASSRTLPDRRLTVQCKE